MLWQEKLYTQNEELIIMDREVDVKSPIRLAYYSP